MGCTCYGCTYYGLHLLWLHLLWLHLLWAALTMAALPWAALTMGCTYYGRTYYGPTYYGLHLLWAALAMAALTMGCTYCGCTYYGLEQEAGPLGEAMSSRMLTTCLVAFVRDEPGALLALTQACTVAGYTPLGCSRLRRLALYKQCTCSAPRDARCTMHDARCTMHDARCTAPMQCAMLRTMQCALRGLVRCDALCTAPPRRW